MEFGDGFYGNPLAINSFYLPKLTQLYYTAVR